MEFVNTRACRGRGWALSHPQRFCRSRKRRFRGGEKVGEKGQGQRRGGQGLSSPRAHPDQLASMLGTPWSPSPLTVPGSAPPQGLRTTSGWVGASALLLPWLRCLPRGPGRSGQPQLSRPLVRPALGLGNVRVRSQVAGRSRRPAWAPEAAVSLSREALGVAAPRVSQIGVLGPCRWGRAIGGGTLPSPSPIPQRPGLGGTRTQAGLRTGLGDIGGLPGAGPTAVGWPSL